MQGQARPLLSHRVPGELRLGRKEEIPRIFSWLLSREGLRIRSVLTNSASPNPATGTYLGQFYSAFLEGACVGVMGANMPVFTPVTAVWALHTRQTSGHREEAHILELQPKHPRLQTLGEHFALKGDDPLNVDQRKASYKSTTLLLFSVPQGMCSLLRAGNLFLLLPPWSFAK